MEAVAGGLAVKAYELGAKLAGCIESKYDNVNVI